MSKFVSPRLDPPSDPIVELFEQRGLAHHAPVIAAVIRASYVRDEANDSSELSDADELLLSYFAEQLRPHATEASEIVGLRTVALIAADGVRTGIDRAELPDLLANPIEAVLRDTADLNDAFRTLLGEKDAPSNLKNSGVAAALLKAGAIDPTRFINVDLVRNSEKHLGTANWSNSTRERDPRLPEFWAALDAERGMDAVRALLEVEDLGTLGALAWGFERCLDFRYPGLADHLYSLLPPLATVLARRRLSEGNDADLVFTRCCWSYGEHLGENAPKVLGENDYSKLREFALAELGRMRTWLRAPIDEDALEERKRYVEAAAFFLLRTDPTSLWDVLRRQLLAFRELPDRSVALDLRTWHETALHDNDPVPSRWSWLPSLISNVLTLMLGRELKRDEALVELRRALAEFCLDRLKTREKAPKDAPIAADVLKEPNASWRLGYIHAVRELYANLGERGHHVLAWSANHDPDEDVRREAKAAHDFVRRSHGLPANVSPRRAVFTAFWCLRQAHVRALGEDVNDAGALRTLRKEVRRQDKHEI